MPKLVLNSGPEKFLSASSQWSPERLGDVIAAVGKLQAEATAKFPACGTQYIYMLPQSAESTLQELAANLVKHRDSGASDGLEASRHISCYFN